ncbi:MAG TPA: S53 family peptidase [Candidatus Solibacter sp.]|nr:S53 family peptidase [Candidatus Solibacter sp.]
MSPNTAMRVIAGSERHPLAGSAPVAAVDPEKTIKLTIYVRPKKSDAEVPMLPEIGHSPHELRRSVADEKILAAFEADPKSLQAVQKFAQANRLKVLESSKVKRSVLVEGKLSDAMRAFDVNLAIYEHPTKGRYRGRTGPVHIPASLEHIVEAVFGFDNRPMGRPLFKKAVPRSTARAARQANTYLPTDLVDLYDMPDGTDGTGQTVAILAFNGAIGDTGEVATGGYSPTQVADYFKKTLKITTPVSLTNVVVHGPGNQPGDGTQETDATGEVLLDICMAGGIAPKAKFFMYFTEFTEQGWVDCITSAVTATNAPSVISCSYGNPEDGPKGEILWTKAAIKKVNEALQRAALAGITVCVASGDQGSTEELPDSRQHCDFPASSPWVLGCGGTRVIASSGVISRETVWNDGPDSATGGGVSQIFPVPSYQTGAGVPASVNPGHRLGRGVPDVASLADPETGVLVLSPDGSVQPIGGTSAAAPLWSGLVARLNQGLGKPVGFLNPVLYKSLSSGVLRDVTEGDNGAFKAGTGWDACTGFGSPNGTRLLTALKSLG